MNCIETDKVFRILYQQKCCQPGLKGTEMELNEDQLTPWAEPQMELPGPKGPSWVKRPPWPQARGQNTESQRIIPRPWTMEHSVGLIPESSFSHQSSGLVRVKLAPPRLSDQPQPLFIVPIGWTTLFA